MAGKRWSTKATVERLMEKARQDTQELKNKGIEPHLAVMLVGENPASKVYVSHKVKACEELGIRSTRIKLDDDVPAEVVFSEIDRLNMDPQVHGILVQLPLPKHISTDRVIESIDPDKDVDGFHPVNVGRLSLGQEGLFPCTPMGVIELLKDTLDSLKGLHAVVVGRSSIVGKPMAQLLLAEHSTVAFIHSRARDPKAICQQADLVIAAVGVPGLVDADWVKPGAYVVDVGINEITDKDKAERLIPSDSKKMKRFLEQGRVLYGDINYDQVKSKATLVTPVPGGVGPLTIAHLMVNCVVAAQRSLRS